MIVQRFALWCQTASAAERSAAIAELAAAWADGVVPAHERRQAEAALTLALDDPSPKVRTALARSFATSRQAPRHVVLALLADIDEIACVVATCSPLLEESDLVQAVESGGCRLQTAIAGRSSVGTRLSGALAERGSLVSCLRLLDNRRAEIADDGFRLIGERFGSDAEMRGALLDRRELPVEIRQTLILELGHALSTTPIVLNVVGARRAAQIAEETCERATACLAGDVDDDDAPALIEHLRASGQLSTVLLLRVVCAGGVDLFVRALVALGGVSVRRVRSIVVEGREPAFRSLIETCGLPAAAAPLFREAVRVWGQVAQGQIEASPEALPQLVMQRVATSFRSRHGEEGFEEVLALLHRLESEAASENARESARRMAA